MVVAVKRLILSLFGLLIATPAWAIDYYVDCTSGSGSACSIGTPCATINTAIGKVSTSVGGGAGVTIHILAGTCAGSGATPLVNLFSISGTSGSHFTLTGPNDRTVIKKAGPTASSAVVDGSSLNNGVATMLIKSGTNGASYIDVSNLTISTTTGVSKPFTYGVHLFASANTVHDVTLSNIEVYGYGQQGINTTPTNPFLVSNLTIDGAYVHGNSMRNYLNSSAEGGGWDQGVTFQSTVNGTIKNSVVINNWGEGVGCYSNIAQPSDGTIYLNNKITNNFSINAYWGGGCINSIMDGNFIVQDNPVFARTGVGGNENISIADETNSLLAPTNHDNIVRNNITVGGRHGFRYGSYQLSRGLQNTSVYNNTFVNPTIAAIDLNTSATPSAGNIFRNNTSYVVTPSGVQAVVAGVSGLTFDHNSWFGNSGAVVGTGDVTANPLFHGGAVAIAVPTYTVVATPAINTAGSGCTNGNNKTLTASGGTSSIALTVDVNVTANAVSSVNSVTNGGTYTVTPNITSGASLVQTTFTGDGCSGVTLTVVWTAVTSFSSAPIMFYMPDWNSPTWRQGSPLPGTRTDLNGSLRPSNPTMGAFELPTALILSR